ncbi:MAG: DUF6090 family protein [Gelidibacter sp.]
MIKIFRNIRQRTLGENRFSRYLVYAVGEIILVVIGILIALGINDWNQDHKNQQHEALYLKDLNRDIKADIVTLQERITGNDERLANIDAIIKVLGSNEKYHVNDIPKFLSYNLSLTSESYFIPEKSTINQIESSSDGNLITNKKLRDRIFSYYSNCERTEKNMEVSIQLYQHHFITKEIAKPVFINKEVFMLEYGLSMDIPGIDIPALAKNKDYLTALIAKREGTKGQNKEYHKLIDSASGIIALIESELK